MEYTVSNVKRFTCQKSSFDRLRLSGFSTAQWRDGSYVRTFSSTNFLIYRRPLTKRLIIFESNLSSNSRPVSNRHNTDISKILTPFQWQISL